MEHTKGNWKYRQESPGRFCISSDEPHRNKIIDVWCDDCFSNECSLVEVEANAKLIAAAPEMLDVLKDLNRIKQLIEYPESIKEEYQNEAKTVQFFIRKVEQAIKKAEQ